MPGHPGGYSAFGSVPAWRYGFRPGFEVPGEAARALVLDASAPVPAGTVARPRGFGGLRDARPAVPARCGGTDMPAPEVRTSGFCAADLTGLEGSGARGR
ncbi:hypothetical protein GCM10020227_01880 [Streptomyces flavovirens]